MNDVQLLLKACCLNPDEDTPRLMLADEIEENGFPGAARYIRDEIKFANEYHVIGKRRKDSFQERESFLDYRSWLSSVFQCDESELHVAWGRSYEFTWSYGDNRRCRFVLWRGLPLRISVSMAMLAEKAKEIFQFPLMSCTVNDRRPIRVEIPTSIQVIWQWYGSTYPQKFSTWENEPHHVPEPIYRYMEPEIGMRAFRLPIKRLGVYSSLSIAINALNFAAYRFGIDERLGIKRTAVG